jgi:drug/metabolite transporter (DMT)-like permease
MMPLLRRLDAWPRRLRWAVFLPAGIASALIVQGVLDRFFDGVGLPRSPASTAGVTGAALLAFAWALTLTFVPAVLSPRPRAVGVVMFAAGLIIRVAPILSAMTIPYQRARLPDLAVFFAVTIGAHALGGGAGLYLIRHLAARTSDHLEPAP